jgi:hypothetical protein
MFQAGTHMLTVLRIEGQCLVPLKIPVKKKHQIDDACYALSATFIFPMSYHNIPQLEEIYCGKGLQIFFVFTKVCRSL